MNPYLPEAGITRLLPLQADYRRREASDVFAAQVAPPSYDDLLRQSEPPMVTA